MALTNRENSREFLTRGKFRLFFSFPPSFLKNRWKLRFQLVFPLARSSYRRHRASELRSGHCQTPSQLLFSPRTHARTFTPKESRSLRIHPEFTQPSPRCATVAKPVIRNWQKGKWRWDESAETRASNRWNYDDRPDITRVIRPIPYWTHRCRCRI